MNEDLNEIRNDRWPVLIFVLAVTVRLLYLLEFKDHPFFVSPRLDSQVYDAWGWSIAGGNWIGGEKAFFISPFYAYFLAVMFKLFGHTYFLPRLVQVILVSGTWALVYLIGRELFSRRTGVIAGVLGSLYGYSIFMDAELLKNSFAAFSLTATVYAVLQAKKRASRSLALLSGLLLGISVVNLPNLLLLLPLFALWSIDRRRRTLGAFLHAALLVTGTLLIIAPVAVRNYIVEKDFVLLTYAGGFVFFEGNNKDADGAAGQSALFALEPVNEQAQARSVPEKALGRTLKSSEVSRYWFSLGAAFVRENPAAFLELTWKKFVFLWNWYEIPDNVDYYYVRRLSKVLSLPLISFGVIAPLAIVGLLWSMRQWRVHALAYGIVALFTVSLIFLIVNARYRLPVVPLLCVYAGGAVDLACGLFVHKRYKALAVALLAFAAFGLMVNATAFAAIPQAFSQAVLGDIYKEKGMCREAVAEYEQSQRQLPLLKSSKLNYAYCLEAVGRSGEAVVHYKQLLDYYPVSSDTRAMVHSWIGDILLKQGDRTGAEAAYHQALQSDEGHLKTLDSLAFLCLLDGDLRKARKYAGKAYSLHPDSPLIIDTLGLISQKEHNYCEAQKFFRRALSLAPGSGEIQTREIQKHLESLPPCGGGR